MSDTSMPKAHIVISRTGIKFPPLKYDSTSTPDTSVVATTRRNGQIAVSRRLLGPTLVVPAARS